MPGAAAGFIIDRHKVDLDEPLRMLGTYKVAIKVFAGLHARGHIAVEPRAACLCALWGSRGGSSGPPGCGHTSHIIRLSDTGRPDTGHSPGQR